MKLHLRWFQLVCNAIYCIIQGLIGLDKIKKIIVFKTILIYLQLYKNVMNAKHYQHKNQ